ncbi:MAG TPA: permease-like cell division protein FtsX [Clostridia bacterium]|nr:permease-like cell division protein FtsX [Clostridia bacterium]
MKIRTTKYIVKEGFVNTYRNKLMSLASIGIVTASIVVLGMFLLLLYVLNINTQTLKDQPEMQAFCDVKLDDTQVSKVESQIKNNSYIKRYKIVTRQEAVEKIKKLLGDDKTVVDGLGYDWAPVSFIIKVKETKFSSEVSDQLSKIDGIEDVKYTKAEINKISRIIYWVQFISIFLIILLLIVSVFIISNTIKLTVFARRKEISIMKYIGSTDWFIRWPFIVEGLIIGFIGAIAAFVLVALTYNAIQNMLNSDFQNVIKLVSLSQVGLQMVLIYIIIGSIIGALGSFISIRKYLHV